MYMNFLQLKFAEAVAAGKVIYLANNQPAYPKVRPWWQRKPGGRLIPCDERLTLLVGEGGAVRNINPDGTVVDGHTGPSITPAGLAAIAAAHAAAAVHAAGYPASAADVAGERFGPPPVWEAGPPPAPVETPDTPEAYAARQWDLRTALDGRIGRAS